MMHTTTARLKDEAMELSGQMKQWIDRAREESLQRMPDREQMMDEVEQVWDRVGEWVAALPTVIADGLGYEKKRSRSRSTMSWLMIASTGAAAMYYLDPKQGRDRRKRLMEMVKGLTGSQGSSSSHDGGSQGQQNVSLSEARQSG